MRAAGSVNLLKGFSEACCKEFETNSGSNKLAKRRTNFPLEPAPSESRPFQSHNDRRATAHNVPEQTSPIVLNHEHDWPLIDAEMIGRNPPACFAIRDFK